MSVGLLTAEHSGCAIREEKERRPMLVEGKCWLMVTKYCPVLSSAVSSTPDLSEGKGLPVSPSTAACRHKVDVFSARPALSIGIHHEVHVDGVLMRFVTNLRINAHDSPCVRSKSIVQPVV